MNDGLREVRVGSKKPWKVVTVNRRYRDIRIVEREYRYQWAADLYMGFVENWGGGYHPSFDRRVIYSRQEPK